MGHHISTSKRDSIKARTDEDPMCVGFISLGSKVLHWLRKGVYSCWTVAGGTFSVYSIFPSVLSLELKTIVYRVLST
jgi:hypothetical protein